MMFLLDLFYLIKFYFHSFQALFLICCIASGCYCCCCCCCCCNFCFGKYKPVPPEGGEGGNYHHLNVRIQSTISLVISFSYILSYKLHVFLDSNNWHINTQLQNNIKIMSLLHQFLLHHLLWFLYWCKKVSNNYHNFPHFNHASILNTFYLINPRVIINKGGR